MIVVVSSWSATQEWKSSLHCYELTRASVYREYRISQPFKANLVVVSCHTLCMCYENKQPLYMHAVLVHVPVGCGGGV